MTPRRAEMNRFADPGEPAHAVGSAGSRAKKIAPRAQDIQSIGNIAPLLRVFRVQPTRQNTRRIRSVKSQELAGGVQFEIRVEKVRAGGRFPILSGRENHEKLAGQKNFLRKNPPSGRRGIFAQRPAQKVDRIRAAILNLDPILGLRMGGRRVFILQPVLVCRHDFIDYQVAIDRVRIDLDRPGAAPERVRCRGQVGNPMVCRPLQAHSAWGRRVELKEVLSPRQRHQPDGRLPVDQNVRDIHALHVLAEIDFNLRQLAHH